MSKTILESETLTVSTCFQVCKQCGGRGHTIQLTIALNTASGWAYSYICFRCMYAVIAAAEAGAELHIENRDLLATGEDS